MTPARAILAVLALATAVLAVAAVRVAVSGSRELAAGRTALAEGRTGQAVAALGRAARWYLPGAGAHREAREALLALADAREAAGDVPGALTALRHVRGAVLGGRWLTTPDADLLATANDRIARLMAVQDAALRGDRALDAAAHRALLARDATPSPWGSAAVVALFLAWVGTTAVGLWRGVRPDGSVRWRALAPWAAGALGLLAAWVWALTAL